MNWQRVICNKNAFVRCTKLCFLDLFYPEGNFTEPNHLEENKYLILKEFL